MKTKLLFTALCIALPLSMTAQEEDDMYFVPKKKDKKERKSEEAKAERSDFVRYEEAVTNPEPAPDYHVGALRSDDEYNRRGRYGNNYGEVRVGNDTVYVVEEEPQAPKVTEEDDYVCSGRLVRFYGGVLSPFYWDYYYDWAFYDPWFYTPWHVGFHYGPYSWHAGWYGPWYHHGWYDPWCDPWYHGCWGWVSHHPVGGTEGSRFGGRRGIGGISAARGTRGDVASASRGNRFDYTRGSMSASRAGRTTTERASATRGTRFGEGSSRSQRTTQGILGNRTTTTSGRTSRTIVSTQPRTGTTHRSTTSTTRSERSYTPSRSYSSGGSSFGNGSFGGSRSGGSFGGGGGRSGGGRGGR